MASDQRCRTILLDDCVRQCAAAEGECRISGVRERSCALARKFLNVIAILIVLAIGAALAYRLFGVEIMRTAMVPSAEFVAQPGVQMSAYADPDMWFSRPGIEPEDPARWTPEGMKPPAHTDAAVFFVHPTSYLERSHWNAPLDDVQANERAKLFLRGQASAFNEVANIWAPRYRQATFGAFLTDKPEATQALALAYGDLASAFDRFLIEAGPNRPIILAGHSQGALHLTRLLREKIAGHPIAKRVVAAYIVGWPVSRATDIKALGLPECATAAQAGCLLSWQSFAEPADPGMIVESYNASIGFDGRQRKGTPIVCTNPINGTKDGSAEAAANLGTLVPSKDMASADLVVGAVSARCADNGFLLIGDPPEMGAYVLPGNNYHVYDYSLFWANIRADAKRRLSTFEANR